MSEDQSFLDHLASLQGAADTADYQSNGGSDMPEPGTYNFVIIGVGRGTKEREWGTSVWAAVDLQVADPGKFENQEARYFMSLNTTKDGNPSRGLKEFIALGTILFGTEVRDLSAINSLLDICAQRGDVVVRGRVFSYNDRSYMDWQACDTEIEEAKAILEELNNPVRQGS